MALTPSVPSAKSIPLRKAKLVQTGPTRPTGDDDIPTEIYLKIIALLSMQDLITCLRVSRFVHIVTSSILYPTIYSTVDVDLRAPLRPSKKQGVLLSLIPPSKPPVGFVDETSVDRSGFRTSVVVFITKEPLPNRFEYTTHLTLPSHDQSFCRNLTPIIAPHLHTLRIRASGPETHLKICSPGVADCPLIRDLRPRRLILGGLHTGLIMSPHGLWGSLYKATCPPPSLRELVVLVGMFSGDERLVASSFSGWQSLPKTIEKLTLVISHGEDGWEEYCEVDYEGLEEALDPYQDPRILSKTLAAVAAGKAQIVEIVGAERTELVLREDYQEEVDLKTFIRAEIKSCLLARGCGLEDAAQRSAGVKFVDEENFIPREEWYDVVRAELDANFRSIAAAAMEASAAKAKAAEPQSTWCGECKQWVEVAKGDMCPVCGTEYTGYDEECEERDFWDGFEQRCRASGDA